MTPEPGAETEIASRPVDVDTGFWLWIVALPLLVAGYVIDLFTSGPPVPGVVHAISLIFVFAIATVVVTFLLLMRHGYRWARTLLTGGAIGSVLFAVTNLLGVERAPVAAVATAVTAITGSVLIIGGLFLLHRKEVQGYFIR